eukprot:6210103-Pleurochrysis_carterae.AAC.1
MRQRRPTSPSQQALLKIRSKAGSRGQAGIRNTAACVLARTRPRANARRALGLSRRAARTQV